MAAQRRLAPLTPEAGGRARETSRLQVGRRRPCKVGHSAGRKWGRNRLAPARAGHKERILRTIRAPISSCRPCLSHSLRATQFEP